MAPSVAEQSPEHPFDPVRRHLGVDGAITATTAIRASGTHSELLASDDLYRRLVKALRIVEPAVG
ncbi:hypothetical protein [Arthrobacter sp. HLT1-21]